MNILTHSIIAGTCLVATAAVAVAGVSMVNTNATTAKADRQVTAQMPATHGGYVTVEERGDGLSVLIRMPAETTLAADQPMDGIATN